MFVALLVFKIFLSREQWTMPMICNSRMDKLSYIQARSHTPVYTIWVHCADILFTKMMSWTKGYILHDFLCLTFKDKTNPRWLCSFLFLLCNRACPKLSTSTNTNIVTYILTHTPDFMYWILKLQLILLLLYSRSFRTLGTL